jgi:hypothetical protein
MCSWPPASWYNSAHDLEFAHPTGLGAPICWLALWRVTRRGAGAAE